MDKNTTLLVRREYCHKLILYIVAILLFLAIVAVVIVKLT